MDNSVRAGTFVFGGLFIGVWLYMLLFRVPEIRPEPAVWGFWGIIGLVIAGGLFASKIANPSVRMALWVVLGVGVGLLAAAAILNQVPEAFGGLLTFVGGALIISGLPSSAMKNDWTPVPPQGMQPPQDWQRQR